MERQLFWAPWNGAGLESLRLVERDEEILVQSVVIGVKDGVPFQAKYEILCDRTWRMREIGLELLYRNAPTIYLQTDGEGNWADITDQPIPSLQGCFEVDISSTPFTNTLAIQRLALQPGETQELTVAYIAVPDMEFSPVAQRYTCVSQSPDGGVYHYDSLSRGFSTDLTVDADGFVINYPETFKRVWM